MIPGRILSLWVSHSTHCTHFFFFNIEGNLSSINESPEDSWEMAERKSVLIIPTIGCLLHDLPYPMFLGLRETNN